MEKVSSKFKKVFLLVLVFATVFILTTPVISRAQEFEPETTCQWVWVWGHWEYICY